MGSAAEVFTWEAGVRGLARARAQAVCHGPLRGASATSARAFCRCGHAPTSSLRAGAIEWAPMTLHPLTHPRHPANQLAKIRAEWGGHQDLWVFGYASLIWR